MSGLLTQMTQSSLARLEEARAKEPDIVCEAALFSPKTGIVDSHTYMLTLLADAERHGANIVYRSRVAAMWLETASVLLAINEDERPTLRARLVVNCAGLHATQVAECIEDFPKQHWIHLVAIKR